MAASLLGPLIPSEVKEAEEKWRKRLLKCVDEAENSLDSDGEGFRPARSPSTPLRDNDLVPAVQKDLGTKKESGENSDAEEGTEEDTMELELALERKKVRETLISWQELFSHVQQWYFKISGNMYCQCEANRL